MTTPIDHNMDPHKEYMRGIEAEFSFGSHDPIQLANDEYKAYYFSKNIDKLNHVQSSLQFLPTLDDDVFDINDTSTNPQP